MTPGRGKRTVLLAVVIANAAILGALFSFKDSLIVRFKTWTAERAAEKWVRWKMSTPLNLGMSGTPLQDFVGILSSLTHEDHKGVSGLLPRIGTDTSAPECIHFVFTPRTALKLNGETLEVTVVSRDEPIENILKMGLASTGRKFRYWVKADSVLIDLDE